MGGEVGNEGIEHLAGVVEGEALHGGAGKFLQARQGHVAGAEKIGGEKGRGVGHGVGQTARKADKVRQWKAGLAQE